MFLQSSYVPFLTDFLVQLYLQLSKHIGQFNGVYRFQNIFLYLQMNCFFCIFKFIITGKKQDLCSRKVRLYPIGQLHAIHIGHLDICHYYIRLKFFHHFKSLYSIVGIADYRKAQAFPVNFFHNDLYYLFFVVYQKNCIYIHVFFSKSVYFLIVFVL